MSASKNHVVTPLIPTYVLDHVVFVKYKNLRSMLTYAMGATFLSRERVPTLLIGIGTPWAKDTGDAT